jgi:PKHD-type hydroxylase
MAQQSIWFYTDIPKDVVTIIENDLSEMYTASLEQSKINGGLLDECKRNSLNSWVPTTHWSAGFMWHYILRANRENFLYNLHCIDSENMQFTQYSEGQYYNWHNDSGISGQYKPISVGNCPDDLVQDKINLSGEMIRKLSFVLQLSDCDDYEGGNLQLMDEQGKNYVAPRRRGTVILFDSRTQHRVTKITKGVRKSLVGWVVGKRWE